MTYPTYDQIARSYSLWGEYIDPSGLHTEAAFNAMTYQERLDFIVGCSGPEQRQPFTVINPQTGEPYELVRDVCHEHPAWVLRLCGVKTQSELQDYLSNL